MRIMVIGAGQMGQGIAQVMAEAGHITLLNNLDHTAPEQGIRNIAERLKRAVVKGRRTEESVAHVLKDVHASHSLRDAERCDMVFEALAEDEGLKGSVLKELDGICQGSCIFASNTSSLPITRLASYTHRPEKVVGMHFMNPVPVMKLVEIIPGLATSKDTMKQVTILARELGKVAVEVRDVPGFVSNRVLQALINEAIWCLYDGTATAEGIDNVMRYGMNHPMGPLETADLIGLDTVLSIQQVIYEGYGQEKYHPCPLLQNYVDVGWLGKKVGRGFYRYEGGKKVVV
ncbi:MAG: 3-hydroxyacyl-CoA dehydrogenase NAD-binding domain-containing protein [Clostridiales bacterium]|nr:3-hydroxyacyl-CoA dehydrogenase NAD-binding domain-containing protein [Clostridiales bacterium]